MDYEPLQIKDSNEDSQGGPPGWFAFATIFGIGITIALVAFIAGMMV